MKSSHDEVNLFNFCPFDKALSAVLKRLNVNNSEYVVGYRNRRSLWDLTSFLYTVKRNKRDSINSSS